MAIKINDMKNNEYVEHLNDSKIVNLEVQQELKKSFIR